MDVTVVMPLQQATLNGAGYNHPTPPLDYANGNKVRGVEEECRAQGIAFLLIVTETFGGWLNVAEREVKKLGAALARHTGQEEGEAISHLWGTLGVLLQRGNVAIFGNRVPAFPEAVVDGILPVPTSSSFHECTTFALCLIILWSVLSNQYPHHHPPPPI